MLDNIKQEVKRWNWKKQRIWDWEDSVSVSNILWNLESNYWITKEVELDLEVFDLTSNSFKCEDLFEFMNHYELVRSANLKYPIILNRRWQILDGKHRLCKAILTGKKKLKGIMIMDSDVF